jgi:hypothetical protein
MIAIRGLAVAAVAGVAAIAFSPRGAADPARETFAVGFRYDADKQALDNYLAFARQAERACDAPMLNTKGVRRTDRACVEGLLDGLVTRMGRPQLAEVHAQRTGLRVDSSRMLAAR